MSARLTIAPRDDVAVASVEGEIDIANTQRLTKEIIDGLAPNAMGLVIDLAEVRYIDSSGVWMLFEIARRLADERRHVAISLPQASPVRRLFKVTHISAAAPLFDSVDEAHEALQAMAEADAAAAVSEDGSAS